MFTLDFFRQLSVSNLKRSLSDVSVASWRALLTLTHGREVYLATFALLGILLIMPLWTVTYLPLGDLPEHAGQLRAIIDYPYYKDIYLVSWFTPYLASYAITMVLAFVFPLIIAIKITLSLCLLAIPVATAFLIRSLKGNRYWVWTAFPAAYSFAFFWGFFSYVVATPLAIGFFAFVLAYSGRQISIKSVLGAAVFSFFLFFSHGLAWLFSMVMAVSILVLNNKPEMVVKKMLPFLLVLPLVVLWASKSAPATPVAQVEIGNYTGRHVERAARELNYVIDEFQKRSVKGEHGHRVLEMASLSIGMPAMPDFVLLALGLLSWPLWLGARFSRNWRRYLPLGTVISAYMIVPYWLFDAAYVYERFAVFLIPVSFFCFENTAQGEKLHSSVFARLSGFIIYLGGVVVVAAVLLITNTTFLKFQQNDADFKKILAVMAPEKRVLQLIFDQDNIFKYSPPYMHFGAWYQAEKRGETLNSFAYEYAGGIVPVHFRGRVPAIPSGWNPGEFDWFKHNGSSYDYFLVRAYQPKAPLFAASNGAVVLIKQQGAWQLFGRAALAQ